MNSVYSTLQTSSGSAHLTGCVVCARFASGDSDTSIEISKDLVPEPQLDTLEFVLSADRLAESLLRAGVVDVIEALEVSQLPAGGAYSTAEVIGDCFGASSNQYQGGSDHTDRRQETPMSLFALLRR